MSFTVSRDQVMAILLAPFIFALLAMLLGLALMCQGRPFFYTSERMKTVGSTFRLYKIRTMRPAPDGIETVLGGEQASRVTALGRFLRRTRLDELPQIINVLRGDIGFIGPRPPLASHVEAFPVHYAKVLSACRPGITGLATVTLHRREEALLSQCRSSAESEELYLRRCLPLKLRIEGIYARNRSVWLDIIIIWRTFARLSVFGDISLGPLKPRRAFRVKASLPVAQTG